MDLFPRHRIEALSDGIYAVALTLLVLELKLPGDAGPASDAALLAALVDLGPRLFSWLVSFLFLALFWTGHQRLTHRLKGLDGRLIALELLHLGLVALAPFGVAIYGAASQLRLAQWIYCGMLGALAATMWLILEYVIRHPTLLEHEIPPRTLIAARVRHAALIACALSSALGAAFDARWFGIPFCGLILTGPLARWLQRRAEAGSAAGRPRVG